jgi:hypothetical protein
MGLCIWDAAARGVGYGLAIDLSNNMIILRFSVALARFLLNDSYELRGG